MTLSDEDIPITEANFELLVAKYKPLILSCIKTVNSMNFNNSRLEYDDLYQEALMALWDAIRLYDASRGVYFGMYLKIAVTNRTKCFARDFLPHSYKKDVEKSTKEKPIFKRLAIDVQSEAFFPGEFKPSTRN